MPIFRLKAVSIRAKLAAILGITIFALAATRALGLSQLGGFLDRFESYTARLELVQQAMSDAHRAEQGLLLQVVAAQSGRRDRAGASAAEEARRTAFQQTDAALGRLESANAEAGLNAQVIRTLRDAHRGSRTLALDGPGIHPQAAGLKGVADRLLERFGTMRKEAESARAIEARIMNRTYVTMVVLVFGAGIVAYLLIVAMITRPLGRVAEVADTVARGDLRSDVQVDSGDELGQVMRSLRDMNHGLAGLIGKVRNVSQAIGSGSDEIASANADFSHRMVGQSAALEQTAATMAQLSTGVGRTAENARQASQRAARAGAIAAKGGEEVTRVAATMEEIDGSARKITEIIAVIDGIAFQTNLLALNAAVEAARAGAHGRGFAVVAAEVRNLAQKSAAAAHEVRSLIGNSLAKVEQGAGAVRSAGETMAEIVDNANDVTRIVEEIASLAAQQAHGLEEVNRAVADMDRTTRDNSELIERAARTAREMNEQSIQLNHAVAVFRLTGDDGTEREDGGEPLSLDHAIEAFNPVSRTLRHLPGA